MENTNTTEIANVPEPDDVPVEIGGRPVTGFSAGGISVSMSSPTEQVNANIASFTLLALQRGIQFGRVRTPGRTQIPIDPNG